MSTTRRIKVLQLAPAWSEAMDALDAASATGLDPNLADLVRIRVSQLNGCAYCLDMHTLDARHRGESEQRLTLVATWREAGKFYSDQERAAFALAEAITLISVDHVPDDVYQAAADAFEDKDLAQLITLIVTINAWTRIGVTGRMEPGHYRPSGA